jgi:Ca2+-binding EF-hand superfamily protein
MMSILFTRIMRNYFELADTGTDKRLNTNEVSHFLNSMNLKLKKDLVKKLMQVGFIC